MSTIHLSFQKNKNENWASSDLQQGVIVVLSDNSRFDATVKTTLSAPVPSRTLLYLTPNDHICLFGGTRRHSWPFVRHAAGVI